MKTSRLIIITAAAVISLNSAFAQTGTSGATATGSSATTSTGMQGDPKLLSDPTMSSKLSNDLTTRNTQLGDSPVTWYDNGKGYYGTYSVNNTDYMTMYDKQGNFQQTYTKGDWNDTSVPANLKSAYSNSQYKSENVTGYWTSTDPNKTGYYMEVQGKNGKTSRVYADENGKFSSSSGSHMAAKSTRPKQ